MVPACARGNLDIEKSLSNEDGREDDEAPRKFASGATVSQVLESGEILMNVSAYEKNDGGCIGLVNICDAVSRFQGSGNWLHEVFK